MIDNSVSDIHNTTRIVSWQESWEGTFASEQALIMGAMAEAGLNGTVYHVGSTSVKGMSSKPIIDILLCPEKKAALETFIPALECIGYTNLGECGRPGRYFLSKGDEPNKAFYLHLCHKDHEVAADQLLFQHIERNDPAVFFSYMHLKSALASLFPENRDMYRSVKGTYIEGVLAAYRLGEQDAAERAVDNHKRIKYWIYEFEMEDKTRQEFETICALHEMTPDEFIEAALLYFIRRAKTDPEGLKKEIQESSQMPEDI